MAKKKTPTNIIAQNRKARHEYTLEQFFEAGLVLQGWEVKSLRAGKANIAESYIIVKNNEVWLLGALITPLNTASTHISPEAQRTRKLLLNRKEIDLLRGAIERKGYTIVPTQLLWKHGRAKIDIAIAKGKKLFDKRQTVKERDWQRDKARVLKGN